MPNRLSKQAVIRANRVKKSIKMIKRTCSSINDLKVCNFEINPQGKMEGRQFKDIKG